MSDLGEALELMYVAPYLPFSTLRATIVDSVDESVMSRALRSRATEVSPGVLRWEEDGIARVLHGRLASAPEDGREGEPAERTWRLWIEAPVRLRVEREGSVGVRDGASWWYGHPAHGWYSNEDDPSSQAQIGDEALLLLDPSPLVGALRFEVGGREMIAGREAFCLRGKLRVNPVHPFALRYLQVGIVPPDEFEYAVDAERGLLLRQTVLVNGDPYWRREVAEIAFDEEFPEDTFDAPCGDRASFAAVPIAAQVTLEEAVRLVEFPVFELELAEEWNRDVLYRPPTSVDGMPQTVGFHYWLADASRAINVTQSAATGDEGCEIEEFRLRSHGNGSSGQWERVGDDDAAGGEYRVTGAAVTVHRDGTRITVRAMTLRTEDVLGLTRKLRRVTA
jgi:hypothetical protein